MRAVAPMTNRRIVGGNGCGSPLFAVASEEGWEVAYCRNTTTQVFPALPSSEVFLCGEYGYINVQLATNDY